MSGKFLSAITKERQLIELDISDEACLPFGFKHKDRVVNLEGKERIFMGVARNPCRCLGCLLGKLTGEILSWVTRDEDKGIVSKVLTLGNLRSYGIVLKSEIEEAEKNPPPDPTEFLEITTQNGDCTFKVDISRKVCLEFGGFERGDRIVFPQGEEATVLGVASMIPGKKYTAKVLWFRMKNGEIRYWMEQKTGETNLKNRGFKLKSEVQS